jgi:hypothetical protein
MILLTKALFALLVIPSALRSPPPGGYPGRTPLEFGKTIDSCLPREALWNELDIALRDSRSSRIWPGKLSSVAGTGIFEGQRIAVTYYSGWFRFTYDYLVRNVIPGQSFRYEATDRHPFIGGATVSVASSASKGLQKLKWEGVYWIDSNDKRGRNFFMDFSSRFFQQLEQNVRQMERGVCSLPLKRASRK